EIGALAEAPPDDDQKVAQTLLAAHPAEHLVAALVRLRREARPAPEELTPPASARPARAPARPPVRGAARAPHRDDARDGGRERGRDDDRGHGRDTGRQRDRGPGAPLDRDGYTWFTINVGRSKNADPKWLIPMLCRRGNITKRAIGKIQILARDTRVEIANDAVEGFSAALQRPDDKDRQVHIERFDAPA
ncbi:MAG TPA: DbpA RNA binding domain-containing protein, partial [Polyangia bacterium]|nr:DbpA RNA binding domain-containing protein [Polyangia bacterium]